MTRKITMLGTGNATVTKCYNTCFTISQGDKHFLVDAGGGNGILTQLERADINLRDLEGMFLTHAHTDHILGAVWVIRMVATRMDNGTFEADFPIYCHEEAAHVLQTLCDLTLAKKHKKFLEERIVIHVVKDGQKVVINGKEFTFFDIHSTKMKQFGFQLIWEDKMRLICLGDEPYSEVSSVYAKGADWLMSESFCLYRDKERFKPYEKHHSTALDAGKMAEELGVKNLILYHTEDKNLAERRRLYTEEAKTYYTGNVVVPDDLEIVEL